MNPHTPAPIPVLEHDGPRPFGTLQSAAEFGHLVSVQQYLPDASDDDCVQAACRALRYATRLSGVTGPREWGKDLKGQAPVILALLIQRLGTPDPRDPAGLTPLLHAAENMDLLTLSAWLDAGADAAYSPNGETALLILEKAWGHNRLGNVDHMYGRLAAAGCNPHQVGPSGVCWGRHPRTSEGVRQRVYATWEAWSLNRQLIQAVQKPGSMPTRLRL